MKITKNLKTIVCVAGFALAPLTAQADTTASADGTAVCQVVANLTIAAGNNLDFGQANPGTAAVTVAPTDPTAGDFAVLGEPNQSINITLPADNVVVMKKGAGGNAQTEIAVNQFVSSPATSAPLAADGSMTLKVGATRAALGAAQESGLYTGAYTVTVAY